MKTHDYKFTKAGDIWICVTAGFVDELAHILSYFESVIYETKNDSCVKLLVDNRAIYYGDNLVNTTYSDFVADYLVERGFAKVNICLALVSSESVYMEALQFEKACHDRGISLRVFLSEEKAKDWLRNCDK